jgi:hypothetical protein
VIAVVGAHGKTGRAVVAALRARGAPVLSLVRRASGANRERVVDLLDERSVTAADVLGRSELYRRIQSSPGHALVFIDPDEVLAFLLYQLAIAISNALGERNGIARVPGYDAGSASRAACDQESRRQRDHHGSAAHRAPPARTTRPRMPTHFSITTLPPVTNA